jgi:hypothetical protein
MGRMALVVITVLLYLHGGMPDYFLTQKYPTGLKKFLPWCGGNSAALESPTAIKSQPPI